ncbi:hypothetical protein GCM10011609_76980 [Lentzea pudingi]|uniref:Uncharacterized protein n=1 Tax=Lentzea pudingi TaxID=1789439 RepID=A0ABQ2IQ36_9PSEU|nr:hypothetical protein [Lentzea pudingi]GGN23863.1 hypothetical protein GCM10011609_76980 [Lentzea pudingi]
MTTTARSLVARAITEARYRRGIDAVGANYRPEDLPQWTRRDVTARKIAERLMVSPDTVAVIDDPDRRYGISRPQPGDLITITDPVTSRVLRFVPDFTAPDQRWLLIDECPDCGGIVPVARVAGLADVGDYLDPDNDTRFDHLPAEHHGDPAHRTDCSHHDCPRLACSHRD